VRPSTKGKLAGNEFYAPGRAVQGGGERTVLWPVSDRAMPLLFLVLFLLLFFLVLVVLLIFLFPPSYHGVSLAFRQARFPAAPWGRAGSCAGKRLARGDVRGNAGGNGKSGESGIGSESVFGQASGLCGETIGAGKPRTGKEIVEMQNEKCKLFSGHARRSLKCSASARQSRGTRNPVGN
jgi:hypothetical protein